MSAFSDHDVLQYVDGSLDDDTAQAIEPALQTDDDLRNRVEAMRASKLPYSEAYNSYTVPAIPENIRHTVNTWARTARDAPRRNQQRGNSILRTALVTSGICLSFLIGFAASKLTESSALFNSVQFDINETEASDIAWVQRVADYQSLYVENTVSAIQTEPREAKNKLSAISAPSGLPSDIPDLSDYGYHFVRVQELGYENYPLIQLVYKSPGKKPLALCFMPSLGPARYSLRLARHASLGSASWRLPNQRFVVVAEESTEMLEVIAMHIQEIFL